MKSGRHIDGVLTRHGIDDQHDVGGLELLLNIRNFIHHGFVDLKTACRIQN